jgi:hypothetical protein
MECLDHFVVLGEAHLNWPRYKNDGNFFVHHSVRLRSRWDWLTSVKSYGHGSIPVPK